MRTYRTLTLSALAATAAVMMVTTLGGQNAPAPAAGTVTPGAAAGAGRGAPAQAAPAQAGRALPQGGRGPIRVLFVSKGHDFDRDGLMSMLDSLGTEITWTHVEHPAAELFYDPANGKDYDAYLFYDAPSRGLPTPEPPNGAPGYRDPGAKAKKDFYNLTQSGKPLVFMHHATAAWNHTWPEYGEMIGAACDWGAPVTFQGKTSPNSGARANTQQHITVLDKTSPITAGLGESFDIVDETYLCETDESLFHPLLKTDFVAVDKNFEARYEGGWRHPGQGTFYTGWYRAVGKSPLVYIQHGHGATAWQNPAYKTLVTNAIKWAVSPEAKAFAAKEGKPMAMSKETQAVK